MIRRFDRHLYDIFMKTELFYQYHQELEESLEQIKMKVVSDKFTKD